ncbi:MAG: radical SAM protein [Candidatus Nanoarchaeia archaeon]|nr:radical SAM protein [Candidatus Nanoarchaeia archaeon]
MIEDIKKYYNKSIINHKNNIFIKILGFFARYYYYKNEYSLNIIDLFFNKSVFFEINNIGKERMPLPWFIQLEPTTKCNFNCEFCTRKTYSEEDKNNDLKLELVKKIIKENKNLKFIKYQGMGESLLNLNNQEIIKFIRKNNINLSIITNGSLLINKNMRDFLLNNFKNITISVDSVNKEEFESIRKGGNFNNIVKGIKSLIEERNNNNNKVKIRTSFVISHKNYKNIPNYIQFFKKINIDEIGFAEIENWKIKTDQDFLDNQNFVLKEREIRKNIFNFLNRENLTNDFNFNYLLEKDYKRKKKCLWGFTKIFITSKGILTPCCIRMEEKYKLGNVLENDFKNTWNNNNLRKFRIANIKNKDNIYCNYCPD